MKEIDLAGTPYASASQFGDIPDPVAVNGQQSGEVRTVRKRRRHKAKTAEAESMLGDSTTLLPRKRKLDSTAVVDETLDGSGEPKRMREKDLYNLDNDGEANPQNDEASLAGFVSSSGLMLKQTEQEDARVRQTP